MPAIPGAGVPGAQFCSVVNGSNDPGALDMELNVSLKHDYTLASGKSFLRFWGIPLKTILGAPQLLHKKIDVYVGMTNGLPLANLQTPQQGLLFSGEIFPALGNWVGTEMTLDLFLYPGTDPGQHTRPKNIVHNWPAQTPLSQAIKNTLKTSHPDLKTNITISDKLILPYADLGFYNSIGQFAQYLHAISMSILGKQKGYAGIKVHVSNKTINIDDGSKTNSKTIDIQFTDLIGQPVWTNVDIVQVTTVMRADIDVGQTVTLPPGLMSIGGPNVVKDQMSGQSYTNISGGTTKFTINDANHFGHFRQNDSYSWRSVFTGAVKTEEASQPAPKRGHVTVTRG